jgi:hypothetical protein
MYRKVPIGGVTAAAVLGAGGTALALTGSDTTGGHPATKAAAAAGHHKGRARLLKRLSHAQIVTSGRNGFVTHDLIKGTVTAVSATSVTVQAADKTSLTFSVGSDTKVRMRTKGQGAASSIGHVAKGDHVLVTGTGASHPAAKHVVDIKK